MFRNCLICLLALLVLASTTWATRPAKDRVIGPEFLSGLEETSPNSVSPSIRPGHATLDDTMRIGTTYYDLQSNGTMGKQCCVGGGYIHFVWTNGINPGSGSRHVYYNALDQMSGTFTSPAGVQIDAASRAGFVTATCTNDGFCYPAFHQTIGANPFTAVAIDYFPANGAFTIIEIPHVTGDPQVIWPKIDADPTGNLHIVATESGGSTLDYYVNGTPEFDQDGAGLTINFPTPWLEWDPATFITMDVAAGRHSPRVAVAWLNDGAGSGEALDPTNVYLRVSEDGGATWGDVINVTNIQPLDTSCVTFGGDPMVCNGDTMHPWIDLSVIMDENDSVHIAFSANAYFYFDTDGSVFDGGLIYSTLWHWFEGRDELNMVREAWYGHRDIALGVNNLMVHRPNLSVDTTNGYLYCSFQQFDSVQQSGGGFPSGDAWITVSTTGGRTWAEATNLSNTVTDSGAAPLDCRSERDISLADIVTDGVVHMQYTLDLDCGTSVSTTAEGVATPNPEYYLPIPAQSIPTEPLVNFLRNFHADSSQFPWDLLSADPEHASLPEQFALYQNYPNPFNPTTRIQFDLASESNVQLAVYDVTGRQVTTLIDQQPLKAGAHVVEFDASRLASGVYFYRLSVNELNQTRKMVLIR
jgi:hypothetical protein